jgi:hypothetical protein
MATDMDMTPKLEYGGLQLQNHFRRAVDDRGFRQKAIRGKLLFPPAINICMHDPPELSSRGTVVLQMFLTFTDAGGPEAFSYLVPSLLQGQEDELLSQYEVCLHAVLCFLFCRGSNQHS